MQTIFHFKVDTKLNLLGKAMIAIDCGYTRVAILAWRISSGADILGTVMRGVNFVLFTSEKEGKKDNNSESEEGPQNFPVDSFKAVHQKIARHSLGTNVGRG